jgi:hypothetical protein
MTDDDPELSRLDRCLAQLSDHYDSIEIITTRHNGEATISVHRGTGNWFSRYGAITEWITFAKARVIEKVRREEDPE